MVGECEGERELCVDIEMDGREGYESHMSYELHVAGYVGER